VGYHFSTPLIFLPHFVSLTRAIYHTSIASHAHTHTHTHTHTIAYCLLPNAYIRRLPIALLPIASCLHWAIAYCLLPTLGDCLLPIAYCLH
jgi:hypothetical protein